LSAQNLPRLFARRAEILRELAGLEEALGGLLGEALRPARATDEALTLPAAAALLGEPVETFRRRLDYRKALLRLPGERRLRYSRTVLERILKDRVAANGEP
jgi:hypothetical protein